MQPEDIACSECYRDRCNLASKVIRNLPEMRMTEHQTSIGHCPKVLQRIRLIVSIAQDNITGFTILFHNNSVMNDLIMQRQCEELTIDEQLDAYEESVMEDAMEIKTPSMLTSGDVFKISNGLQLQSLYREFQSTPDSDIGKKSILRERISIIVGRQFKERTKDWSSKDRETRYSQQEKEWEKEYNPF